MKQPVAKLKCLACGHTDYRMSAKPVGDLFPDSCPECGGDMTIKGRDDLSREMEKVGELVDEYFYISDFIIAPEQMEFLVDTDNLKENFSKLLRKIRDEGYLARIHKTRGELHLLVRETPEQGESNVLINIALFLATIFTTFVVAGYWYLYDGNILYAALFSSSLLTILGAHELGHKISAWKHEVDATWPYFLPVPHPLLGTFGAIIKNKSPIPSKEGLVEIGAAGPLLGVVFAIPITIVGLNFSRMGGGIFQWLPSPLIFSLLGSQIFGHPLSTLDPHPLAWAGFIGLLVTWLNLLPAAQLDGGHVMRGLLNQKNHFILTRTIGFMLLFLGIFFSFWRVFLLFGLLILFMSGTPHPGALDDISELDKHQKIIAFIALVVFILCLPVPKGMI